MSEQCASLCPNGHRQTVTAPASDATAISNLKIRCVLEQGHGGRHRCSPWLSWHDPPRVFVGGREVG